MLGDVFNSGLSRSIPKALFCHLDHQLTHSYCCYHTPKNLPWICSLGSIFIQETERLVADPAPGITAEPHDDNLRYFDVTIEGPGGSPFESKFHFIRPNCATTDRLFAHDPLSIDPSIPFSCDRPYWSSILCQRASSNLNCSCRKNTQWHRPR